MLLIDPGNPIEDALDGPQHRIEERAFPAEHLGHEDSHGFRDCEYQQQKHQDLKPTVSCHQNFSRLEPPVPRLPPAELSRRSFLRVSHIHATANAASAVACSHSWLTIRTFPDAA